MPPLRNLWRYYPNIKGLCTGIVLCGFGFSAIILNKISNTIINPDHVEIDKTTEFYPEYIGLKVPNYYFVASISFICFGLLGSLFIFEHEEKKNDLVAEYLTSDLIVNKNFNFH
jgi:hypothetical protein